MPHFGIIEMGGGVVQKIVAERILLTRQIVYMYMLIVEIDLDHIPSLGIGLEVV